VNLARKRGKRRLSIESMRLPLVALIDVVLFLLFYFMVAASIDGGESQLPMTIATRQARGAGSSMQAQIVDVRSFGSSAMYVVGDRSVTTQEELRKVISGLSTDVGIIIRVEGEVSVEAAAMAVQAATDAGFTQISYVAGK
jgi:biopolymer transport protein ExbD